jgi:hypothetical protein
MLQSSFMGRARSLFGSCLLFIAIGCSSNGTGKSGSGVGGNCGTEGAACCNGDACAAGLVCQQGSCLPPSTTDAGGGKEGGGITGPTSGAACTSPEGSLVCGKSADGSQSNLALLCKGGVYMTAFQCPGLEKCGDVQTLDEVTCGTTFFAQSGAPCAGQVPTGAQFEGACSFDLTKVEVCQNGVWVDGIHCPPSACANVPKSSSSLCSGSMCSNCGETVGDVCSFQAGAVICSTDLSAILQCSNGKTTVYQQCGTAKCTEVSQGGMIALACQ